MNLKALLPAMFALALCGCQNDAYDWSDDPQHYLQGELVDVTCNGEGVAVSFTTDDNQTFELLEKKKYKWMEKGDTIYRAACIYQPEDGKAAVTAMGYVCVLWPVALRKLKGELKTDPVVFESAWLSANRRYLNLSLMVKMGQGEAENGPQQLGVVVTDTLTSSNGDITLNLTLFHDQKDVPEYYSQRSYCSIPLDGIKADRIRLSVCGYDRATERIFEIKK